MTLLKNTRQTAGKWMEKAGFRIGLASRPAQTQKIDICIASDS